MKRPWSLVGLALAAVGLALCPRLALGGEGQPDLGALQRQIDELKQQVKGLEEMKTRLAQLEEQLEAARAFQKKAEEASAQAGRERKIDGYLQLRYQADAAPDSRTEFLVRRARFNVRGSLSERTSYRFELQMDSKEKGAGPGSKAQLRTANIDYAAGRGRLRLGQAKIPWGYELEVSSAELWSGERSLFMDRLFPNQRDIGLQYQWTAGERGPVVDLGLFNGTGINASDDNSRKDPMARLKFPFRCGSAAVSYYDGRNEAGTTAGDRTRLGLGAEADWQRLSFLGEYVTGKDVGADAAGWYAQVGYRLPRSKDMVFIKHDYYDENRDRPDDAFRRTTLGYIHALDSRSRLTVAYELRRVDPQFSELSKWDGDAGYMQLQVRY
jgi:hypothetical protein